MQRPMSAQDQPSTSTPGLSDRARRSAGWCLAFGSAAVLGSAWTHASGAPTWFGLYSSRYLMLLASLTLVWAGGAWWLRQRWPSLASKLHGSATRTVARPALLFSYGALAVVGSVFYGRLIGFYIAWPVLSTGLALLTAGLGILVWPSAPERRRRVRVAAGAMTVFWLVLLVAVEFVLRALSHGTPYTVWAPHTKFTVTVAESAPGVYGPSNYTTDAYGIRGDALPTDDRPRVLAIGGSTTACTMLDDSEAWPWLTQQRVNALRPEAPVWVGNVGRPGHGAIEHAHILEHLATQHGVDAAIILVGFNDIAPTLQGAKQPPDMPLVLLNNSFYLRPTYDPNLGRGLPEDTALFGVVERAWWRMYGGPQDAFARIDDGKLTQLRADWTLEVPTLPALPDLEPALVEYRRALNVLADTIERTGIRTMLVSQPVLWRPGLSKSALGRIYLAYKRDNGRRVAGYDLTQLRDAMQGFNDVLREVARERSIPLVDLAPELDGSEEDIYDDCHFSEPGARRLADILAPRLVELLTD